MNNEKIVKAILALAKRQKDFEHSVNGYAPGLNDEVLELEREQ